MKEAVLKITAPRVRKLFVEATETLTGYERGRVLIETYTDRRPADGKPYCTLWFKNLEPLPVNVGDWYFSDVEEGDAIQIIDNESLCVIQFSFWGPDAYGEAVSFMQTLHAQRRFHDLWRIVGFAGIDSVQDISTQYGGKIQQRAFFDLSYYVCLGRALPADWFDTSRWLIADPAINHKEKWNYPEEDKNGVAGSLS